MTDPAPPSRQASQELANRLISYIQAAQAEAAEAGSAGLPLQEPDGPFQNGDWLMAPPLNTGARELLAWLTRIEKRLRMLEAKLGRLESGHQGSLFN